MVGMYEECQASVVRLLRAHNSACHVHDIPSGLNDLYPYAMVYCAIDQLEATGRIGISHNTKGKRQWAVSR